MTYWGGMVTQGGVQKPVLEAIVDMMKAGILRKILGSYKICVWYTLLS